MSISLPISSGTIGNISQLTVDARSLHEVLEVKRDFSTWIKGRISKYSFKENEDFVIFTKSGENSERGRNSIEYRLSVNMGKELAMVENNERGRMVRRYFIECERRLMETPAPALPTLSIEDRRPLSNLIGQWAGKAKISFPDCWRELHAVFNISTVAELPASQLPAALAWVQARIDALDKPDFPLELANCGKRGKDHVNLWTELEDLKKKLAHCNSMVFLACSSGRSMLLTSEKNLWHATLAEAVRHAQNCLEMAQQNVQTALRIKAQVDFHTI